MSRYQRILLQALRQAVTQRQRSLSFAASKYLRTPAQQYEEQYRQHNQASTLLLPDRRLYGKGIQSLIQVYKNDRLHLFHSHILDVRLNSITLGKLVEQEQIVEKALTMHEESFKPNNIEEYRRDFKNRFSELNTFIEFLFEKPDEERSAFIGYILHNVIKFKWNIGQNTQDVIVYRSGPVHIIPKYQGFKLSRLVFLKFLFYVSSQFKNSPCCFYAPILNPLVFMTVVKYVGIGQLLAYQQSQGIAEFMHDFLFTYLNQPQFEQFIETGNYDVHMKIRNLKMPPSYLSKLIDDEASCKHITTFYQRLRGEFTRALPGLFFVNSDTFNSINERYNHDFGSRFPFKYHIKAIAPPDSHALIDDGFRTIPGLTAASETKKRDLSFMQAAAKQDPPPYGANRFFKPSKHKPTKLFDLGLQLIEKAGFVESNFKIFDNQLFYSYIGEPEQLRKVNEQYYEQLKKQIANLFAVVTDGQEINYHSIEKKFLAYQKIALLVTVNSDGEKKLIGCVFLSGCNLENPHQQANALLPSSEELRDRIGDNEFTLEEVGPVCVLNPYVNHEIITFICCREKFAAQARYPHIPFYDYLLTDELTFKSATLRLQHFITNTADSTSNDTNTLLTAIVKHRHSSEADLQYKKNGYITKSGHSIKKQAWVKPTIFTSMLFDHEELIIHREFYRRTEGAKTKYDPRNTLPLLIPRCRENFICMQQRFKKYLGLDLEKEIRRLDPDFDPDKLPEYSDTKFYPRFYGHHQSQEETYDSTPSAPSHKP